MKEIYRTEPVKIPEEWQRKYKMPKGIPAVVLQLGKDFHIALETSIYSVDGAHLLRVPERPLSYKTRKDAIKAADGFRDDLAKVVSENLDNVPIRARTLTEPVYELSISGNEKYCLLMAEVYATYGGSIKSGRYFVTEFWRLGHQKTMRRDERGYFEKKDLERLMAEVEKGYGPRDVEGKPFFINAFLFTRMTGRSKTETFPIEVARGQVNSWETYHESPVEFYQIEVDPESRMPTGSEEALAKLLAKEKKKQ